MFWSGSMSSAGGLLYAKYRMKGEPMPFAIAYLPEPTLYAIGTSQLPFPKYDEYAIAGGFRGEPVEVVESETIPGLMVPAHAEWIIEGEFLPEDYKVPIGAEAIWQGYMYGGELCPVARIKCITHRKNPWWYYTFSMKIVSDHPNLGNNVYEAEVIRDLRELGYRIKDVVAYDLETVVIQSELDGMQKAFSPHYGKLILNAVYGGRNRLISGKCNKFFIVVGPDVDPYDPREVLWAVNSRVMPISDSIFIEKGLAGWGDPSAESGLLGWRTFGEQMLIDALIKVPEKWMEFPPVSEPKEWEKVAIEKMKAKIGE